MQRNSSLSGWSLEVLKYLYEIRQITASGHEPTDTDPGVATSVAIIRWKPTYLARTITRLSCSPTLTGPDLALWYR